MCVCVSQISESVGGKEGNGDIGGKVENENLMGKKENLDNCLKKLKIK